MKYELPQLQINEDTCRNNLRRIHQKIQNTKIIFRPHFKTHQSAAIGNWFREHGISKITVSSIKMADYFAKNGWSDIFIAFPVNILDISKINSLSKNINLHLSVESKELIQYLNSKLYSNVGIYIKIDTGYHRTGLEPSEIIEIKAIVSEIKKSSKMNLTGFYTHAGHTYNTHNIEEIRNIHNDSINILKKIQEIFIPDFPEAIISIGDTPSASLINDFSPADEIRPGNFIFYDLMQFILGVCKPEDIAISLKCPIVAKHKTRNEIVIHGGAVHLSKESIHYKQKTIYGLLGYWANNGNLQLTPDCFVQSLSQEHGIISSSRDFFNSVKIGETINIIPVHSCLTANLADKYFLEKNVIISKMRS